MASSVRAAPSATSCGEPLHPLQRPARRLLVLILLVGPIQDALFGMVLVANSAVGIVQVGAKRTLDRLSLLNAPTATVVRDGETRKIAAEAVVLDDVVALGPATSSWSTARCSTPTGSSSTSPS